MRRENYIVHDLNGGYIALTDTYEEAVFLGIELMGDEWLEDKAIQIFMRCVLPKPKYGEYIVYWSKCREWEFSDTYEEAVKDGHEICEDGSFDIYGLYAESELRTLDRRDDSKHTCPETGKTCYDSCEKFCSCSYGIEPWEYDFDVLCLPEFVKVKSVAGIPPSCPALGTVCDKDTVDCRNCTYPIAKGNCRKY